MYVSLECHQNDPFRLGRESNVSCCSKTAGSHLNIRHFRPGFSLGATQSIYLFIYCTSTGSSSQMRLLLNLCQRQAISQRIFLLKLFKRIQLYIPCLSLSCFPRALYFVILRPVGGHLDTLRLFNRGTFGYVPQSHYMIDPISEKVERCVVASR